MTTIDPTLIGGCLAIASGFVGYGALSSRVKTHSYEIAELRRLTQLIERDSAQRNAQLARIEERVIGIHDNCVACRSVKNRGTEYESNH